ncbi:hypothetical protein Pfo_008306 [Paulownia fortunei]|nr:hypothetical protein Pfo_008306 [Paulownia fortunei]
MDSSSKDTLSKLFEEIIKWRRRRYMIPDGFKLHWTGLHLSVVGAYVLKLDLNSDFRVLSYAKLINVHSNKWFDVDWYDIKYDKIVASFMQELQEFFIVPRLHQLFGRDNAPKKNELVAAFINFLLHLLSPKTDLIDPFQDQIDSLEKELRFILTVLGDTSLLSEEHEQVQSLLAEFEEVANEAGSLLHSFFFSMDRVFQSMDEGLGVLLKHINLLKANIIKFSNLLPFISTPSITPKTSAMDSLLIVDSLLHDLENLMNREDNPIADVKDHIKMLHQGLIFSQSFIKDIGIGLPQTLEIKELKEPLMRIGDVAYEVDYLITSFLVGDAPFWYLITRLTGVIHKIELIGTGLQEIKKKYDIGALKVAKNFDAQLSLQAKRNSEVDDITVGFEDEATNILDQLVGGTEHLQIISIYGMPGLGKTTLAKKLYNHPSVNYRFDKCSWCVVSQTYQRRSLFTDILISSASERDKDRILNMEEESLVQHIYQSLKGRRYLIVIDDIWSSNAWDDLRRCFPDDGNGSRILFTSRHKDVAPPNSIIYALPSLSNDQCWELLEKKVFHNERCPSKLVGIGKEIAANCRGLPLAVVVIAGILSTMDKEESMWKKVGGNLASYIFDGGDNYMMQILELSYKHLPEHLKPCFLYFGAFPEDTEIPARKLKRLWIAEGFISKEQRNSSESVAEEYLMELIHKSLVIVAKRRSDGGVKACVVHDLLRELCLRRGDEENFLKLVVDVNYSIYQEGRRLPLLKRSLTPFGQHVRSFHGYHLDSPFYVRNMKLLRVLDFDRVLHTAKLIGVEYLVHLRYLVINCLPASIGSLVNLEYLLVDSGHLLLGVKIPFAILRMFKLRYLHVTTDASFHKDCNSSQVNKLEYLSHIRIKNLKDEEMLKCSPNLRKLKCRCEPLWVEEKGTYRYPDLRFLTQLESLKMTAFHKPVMAEINFPSNIKKLALSGLRLPWEKMSIIGRLPNLEVLKLSGDEFVGETWDTTDGEFQQLRFLKLAWLGITKWNVSSSDHFPRLRRLVLLYCSKLQEIPCEMGEIATLQSIEVVTGSETVALSAIEIQKEQRDMGNEDLRVIIS